MTAMLPLLLAMPGWHSKLHTRCWKVPGRPATSNLQGTIAAAPGTMILPGIPYISRPLLASAFSPPLHDSHSPPPPHLAHLGSQHGGLPDAKRSHGNEALHLPLAEAAVQVRIRECLQVPGG